MKLEKLNNIMHHQCCWYHKKRFAVYSLMSTYHSSLSKSLAWIRSIGMKHSRHVDDIIECNQVKCRMLLQVAGQDIAKWRKVAMETYSREETYGTINQTAGQCIYWLLTRAQLEKLRNFPGGPVLRLLHRRGSRFNPCQKIKIRMPVVQPKKVMKTIGKFEISCGVCYYDLILMIMILLIL